MADKNFDILKGKWKQFEGDVQNEWGKLTDDQVAQVKGDVTKLIGLIQEQYGKSKSEAEEAVYRWQQKHEQELQG